jgi:flagellar L-ring protein precursor FlgH
MKLITLLTCLGCTFAASLSAQNPYVRASVRISSIADNRARHIGDILTITIQESTTVRNETRTERSNDTPRLDIRKEQAFNGEARQNQNSDVRASIAVVVIDVQPNGNLVVAGVRSLAIDDETRTLRVSGLVRPLDVTPANTVTSAQVAEARIAITGDGANTRQVTRGPVGQLFDSLVWAAWPF